MKRLLLIFLFAFFVCAQTQQWKLIGLSGNSYPIDVIKDGEKGYFVPAYQIWKNLNFIRTSTGDTISVKINKNELKMFRNDDKCYFNATAKNLKYSTLYTNSNTYCDIASFCELMNAASGLYFDHNASMKEIRVGKTQNIDVSKAKNIVEDDKISGIIVIDPGHGGKDPGATGPGGTNEKDIVLPISLEVKKYLSKYKNIKVFLTRETDSFIALHDRAEFANKKNADLFISIHANASEKSPSVGGYKMYFLSEAKDEIDEWTAKLENSVIDLESKAQTNGLESILLSLANNEFIKESQDFSIMLAKSFGKNMKEIQKLHTGVGQANFYVLNGASMPAVLVETAFISNTKEEKLLKDKKFQKDVAESIGGAAIEFCKKYVSGLRDK
ncbi:MAG: N-acetylmuramoyl-L-alanine amidase [Chitinispirillales bacterium]|jgi:N-acetylmuramoyl-L-alanine amidase|nr:N-acetylmuramoyl-L-alanine amidase [Chitinispirillales bacterium]